MRTVLFAIASAVVAGLGKAVDVCIDSCAELAGVDDETITSLTIHSSTFECDSYTRFRVHNGLTIKSDSDVVFSNFAIRVVEGDLVVEPNVVFEGITDQEKNGGALKVEKGATATFMGTSLFTENSIKSSDSSIKRKGGAVHNKGTLVFEGDATFMKNEARTQDSTDRGRGGAISNMNDGSITFKSRLTMDKNRAEGFFEGFGGAIYNLGDIVVEGVAAFAVNIAAQGGAIYVGPGGAITFGGMATFTENACRAGYGGAIASSGSLNLLGSSLFKDNFADSAGDGGVGGAVANYGNGYLTFGGGNATFDGNWGYLGGAIYIGASASMTPPQDKGEIIFLNSKGGVCPKIYYRQPDGPKICGPPGF